MMNPFDSTYFHGTLREELDGEQMEKYEKMQDLAGKFMDSFYSFSNDVSWEKKEAIILKIQEMQKVNRASRKLVNFIMNNLSTKASGAIRKLFSELGYMVDKYALDENDLDSLLEGTPQAHCEYGLQYCPDEKER